MRDILLILLLLYNSIVLSQIKIGESLILNEDCEYYVLMTIVWKNAWHNKRNHNAMWLSFQFTEKNENLDDIKVSKKGHTIVSIEPFSNLDLQLDIPKNQSGLFVYPKRIFNGNIKARLKIKLVNKDLGDFYTNLTNFHVSFKEVLKIPKHYILSQTDN